MKMAFVCTGNVCRSAAAEIILEKMNKDNGITNVGIASCGTKVPDGLALEEVMCRIAAEHSYAMGGMAVPAAEDILNDAGKVVVMTQHHSDQVTRILKYDNWDRIVLFNDFCFGEKTDLPDPHYQSEHVYRTSFNTIERGCQEIIIKLKNL